MDSKKFIEELSSRLDISQASVTSMIDLMVNEIGSVAANMDSVVIPGFGTFEPRLRQERLAVHPASGKKLLVPPRINLYFKQSPVLKQKINNGK
ncbi:MAG: HU family DNA-binding protein [Muribaculaceae bacterium]|nr:HU family DNA-binding protein [Muribaculaceae bacterium]